MPANIGKSPLSLVPDAFISFLRYVFANPEIIPLGYRYFDEPENTRETRTTDIDISGIMPMLDEKPLSTPNVIISRGEFTKNNAINANIESGSINTFNQIKKMLIADGTVTIAANCNHAAEASDIINMIVLLVEDNKRNIMDCVKFIRLMNFGTISREIPSEPVPHPSRWTVYVNFYISIYLGVWMREIQGEYMANKISVKAVDKNPYIQGVAGSIIKDKETLTDANMLFGFTNSHNPKFNSKEFENYWYYLKFENDDYYYIITKIDSPTTIKLAYIDENRNLAPFSAKESLSNLKYEILWNSNHIYVEIPKS